MLKLKFAVVSLLAVLILATGSMATAQNPTLSVAQPVSADITADGVLLFDYTLAQTSQITLQAISATAQVALSILKDGQTVESQPNTAGEFTVTLNAMLTAGDYQVRAESLNSTAGTVIVLIQSETPVSITEIGLDTFVSDSLTDEFPLALYQFGEFPESAYLYIESELPQGGLSVILTAENGDVIGSIGNGITGTRFTLPLSSASYTIQLSRAEGITEAAFSLCLTAVSVRGCEFGGNVEVPVATAVTAPVTVVCTVTPSNSGGANIRQSASTGSIVVGALPGNQSADVLGISPDKAFFNIQYNTINGWVAQSVVTTTGDCSTLQTVQPPAVIAPTNTPTPTPIPPTATPEGPCLVFINSPTFTYTTTVTDPSNVFDQIQSGTVEAIGRTADNGWWQVNYGPSWLQTSTFGNSTSTAGGCHNLPIVSP